MVEVVSEEQIEEDSGERRERSRNRGIEHRIVSRIR